MDGIVAAKQAATIPDNTILGYYIIRNLWNTQS